MQRRVSETTEQNEQLTSLADQHVLDDDDDDDVEEEDDDNDDGQAGSSGGAVLGTVADISHEHAGAGGQVLTIAPSLITSDTLPVGHQATIGSPYPPYQFHPHDISNESLWFLLSSIDFWLLWVAFVCLSGVGLMWKNLVGNLVQSMGQDGSLPLHGDTAAIFSAEAVQYWSIATAIGRIASGIASDVFVQRIPRPMWLVFSGLLMCVAMLGLALFTVVAPDFVLTYYFWLADIGNAMAYGAAFCMASTVMSLLFGTHSLSRNYGVLLLAPALGGLVATAIASTTEIGSASGVAVYRVGLWVSVAMCVVSVVLSLLLTRRYTKVLLFPLNITATLAVSSLGAENKPVKSTPQVETFIPVFTRMESTCDDSDEVALTSNPLFNPTRRV